MSANTLAKLRRNPELDIIDPQILHLRRHLQSEREVGLERASTAG